MRAVGRGRSEGGAHSRAMAARQRVPNDHRGRRSRRDDEHRRDGQEREIEGTHSGRCFAAPSAAPLVPVAGSSRTGPGRVTRRRPRTRPRTRVAPRLPPASSAPPGFSTARTANAGCRRWFEVRAEDLFGIRGAALRQQRRAQPLALDQQPVRRLVVAEAIFGGDRAGERRHRRRLIAAGTGDPALEIRRRHGEQGPAGIGHAYHHVLCHPRRGRRQRLLLPRGVRDLALPGVGRAPHEAIERGLHGARGRRRLQREHLVEASESQRHRAVLQRVGFQHR